MAKAVLTPLIRLLPIKREASENTDGLAEDQRSKKSKKRARGYEGDEVLRLGKEASVATEVEGEELLASMEGQQSHTSSCD